MLREIISQRIRINTRRNEISIHHSFRILIFKLERLEGGLVALLIQKLIQPGFLGILLVECFNLVVFSREIVIGLAEIH